MRAMRDSGHEWIGQIPIAWGLTQAGQCLYQVKDKNDGMIESNLLSLSYGKVKRRDIDARSGLLPESFEGYNIVEDGDIVLRFTDLQNDHCSLRTGLVTERGIITSAYTTVRPINYEMARYLHYALHAFDVRKGFYGMGSGVRQGLKWQEAKYIVLPLPDADSQVRIANYLDEKIADVDNAIAAAEASVEEYTAYLDDITYRTVMGYTSSDLERVDTGVEWLGTIPANWKLVPFRRLYREVSIDNNEGEELLSVYLNRGVIRYSDSDGNQVHKPSESLAKYQLVVPGNLVLNNQQAWRGSVGVSAFRGIVSPAYHVYEQIGSELDNDYANLLFRGPWVPCFTVSSTGVGSIQRNVSKGQLKSELVPVPPINEQLEIVNRITVLQQEVGAIVAYKQSIIEDLQSYKQSLVYEVVTGKREV